MHRMVRDLLCIWCYWVLLLLFWYDSRCMEKSKENITQNGNSKTKRRNMQIGNNTLLDMKSNRTKSNQVPKPKTKDQSSWLHDMHVRSERKVEFDRAQLQRNSSSNQSSGNFDQMIP